MNVPKSFELAFPIPRTHCGIPLGNGNLGALIWGNQSICLTLNRSDFWDHRGGEVIEEGISYNELLELAKDNDYQKLIDAFPHQKFPDTVSRPKRLPFGRFEMDLRKGQKLKKAILDYETGTLKVLVESGSKILFNLSTKENVLLIEDKDKLIHAVRVVSAWEFKQSRRSFENHGFVPPEIINDPNTEGWIQSCPDDPSLAAVCRQINDSRRVIALELGETNKDAKNKAVKSIENLKKASMLEENKKWWAEYWHDTPEINLPDEFFNVFFKYALYKFASATHPNSPLPAGLQGPWVEEYQPAPWSADYHFNVNVQQVYTLAFNIGKLDHLIPLFNMLESKPFRQNMQHNARTLFGIDDGLLLTHAVDNKGFQCGGIAPCTTLDQACGAWTAQLYWLYYKYSLDEDFLRNRAYPFMRGVMRVYEEMLEDYQGRLSIPLSISAEYGFLIPDGLRGGRDPSYQLAAIHMLTNALLEASAVLNKEPCPVWKQIKHDLPHFTLVELPEPGSMKKEKRIAVWENQDLEICHRHHSHLAAIYPFDSLPENLDEEMDEIINNSIDHWINTGMGRWSEWCFPWAAIIETRLGFRDAPLVLLNMWKEVYVNEGIATVYKPRFKGITAHGRKKMLSPKNENEVMQLDGTMGGATALLEMLAHTHSGITKIFGGIPDRWQDVSFKNIRQPGPFLISAEKQKGIVVKIKIKNLGTREICLDVGKDVRFANQNGETFDLPGKIKMRPDQEISLSNIEGF